MPCERCFQALHLSEAERFVLSQASLFIPGGITHVYMECGQFRACKVSRSFSGFQRVELMENMVNDHTGPRIFEALHGVRFANRSATPAPQWQPFSEAQYCACCDSDFTWNRQPY
jgi:hypothetical protein